MSLVYRGQKAQPSPVANTLETGMKGKFLGQSFPLRSNPRVAQRTKTPLQYRGVVY